MAHLREILTRAKLCGYERAILAIDAVHAFALSIGVYVPAVIRAKHKPNGHSGETVQ
jgi:hypothetical protein